MHIRGDARESNVGRTVEDRLEYCFAMLDMAVEVAVGAIQRKLGCTREEALCGLRQHDEQARWALEADLARLRANHRGGCHPAKSGSTPRVSPGYTQPRAGRCPEGRHVHMCAR